ncbi:lysoplasmalogenase [Anguilla rostrata]|uniref:lysoplasmalogenase n=1 Tax=Anguilla rostrata TaxID=7938 RepID=UPI0030D304C8
MDILETDAYDRRQRRNSSCVLFLFLLPFFIFSSFYFYLWIPQSEPSVFAAAVKSGPVLSLAALVLLYNGGRSFWGVAGGLLLSACGDCCLIWQELFLHGMAAFGLAHLLYSFAFLTDRYSSPSSSSSTTSLFLSIFLWLTGAGTYFYLLPFLQKRTDSAILIPALGAYMVLIVAMVTLALHTRRPATAVGGLSFLVSDLTLSLQIFGVVDPFAEGRAVIMTTYYLAQLLIAVGDVTAGSDTGDGLRKRKRM